MCGARTPRLILQQIALISLIAERPHFFKTVAMVHKKLSEVVNVTKRVAGSGEWGVVVAVQEDDRNMSNVSLIRAESDHRHAQVGVDDDRKARGECRADLGLCEDRDCCEDQQQPDCCRSGALHRYLRQTG